MIENGLKSGEFIKVRRKPYPRWTHATTFAIAAAVASDRQRPVSRRGQRRSRTSSAGFWNCLQPSQHWGIAWDQTVPDQPKGGRHRHKAGGSAQSSFHVTHSCPPEGWCLKQVRSTVRDPLQCRWAGPARQMRWRAKSRTKRDWGSRRRCWQRGPHR